MGHGLVRFATFLEWKVTFRNAANIRRTHLACVLSVRPQEARFVTNLIVPAQQPSPSDTRSGHKISFRRLDEDTMDTRVGSCPGLESLDECLSGQAGGDSTLLPPSIRMTPPM
jgi:hypothetical protein